MSEYETGASYDDQKVDPVDFWHAWLKERLQADMQRLVVEMDGKGENKEKGEGA